MDIAKERKSSISSVARHLLASAHQALISTRQTVVAKILNVADSTVLRRTEKFPECMETLAASGIVDFVMKGEIKLPLEQYRHLIWIQMDYSKIQLGMTEQENAFSA